jgi:hypothetical protein
MIFHRCFLSSFDSFGQAVSDEKIFYELTNQQQELPVRPCLLMDPDEISNLYRGPSIDATYQVSVYWPSGFRVKDFLGIDQSATRTAYGGHVCYELSRNEQSL